MDKELVKVREMLASTEDKYVNDLLDHEAYKGIKGRYRQKENDLIMDITLKKAMIPTLKDTWIMGLASFRIWVRTTVVPPWKCNKR